MKILFRCGLLFLALVVLAPLTHRFGWLPFGSAFALFGTALMGCLAILAVGFLVILVSIFRSRKYPTSLLVIMGLCALPPVVITIAVGDGFKSPTIHDISTDTLNPPQFVFAREDRLSSDNPTDYGGVEIATAQLAAYPELKPHAVMLPRDRTYQIALQTAREMGWKLLGEHHEIYQFEAVDQTTFFAFKDDIAVRVSAGDYGDSVLDVRSASRVGGGDLGANARRISKFLQTFDTNLSGADEP